MTHIYVTYSDIKKVLRYTMEIPTIKNNNYKLFSFLNKMCNHDTC